MKTKYDNEDVVLITDKNDKAPFFLTSGYVFDITNNIESYEVCDMIVKMMEIDEPTLEVFSNRQLSKIFSKWMSMSNHIYEKKKISRYINLSTSIKTILNTNNYTFNEMVRMSRHFFFCRNYTLLSAYEKKRQHYS